MGKEIGSVSGMANWGEWRRGRFPSLRPPTTAPFTLLLICCAGLRSQTCTPGEVRVVVLDSQESPVFNAQVSLSSDAPPPASRSTQASGLADFPDLPCGAWNVSVEAE